MRLYLKADALSEVGSPTEASEWIDRIPAKDEIVVRFHMGAPKLNFSYSFSGYVRADQIKNGMADEP